VTLPNLIVIGAAKCGTTSLHEYLDLHPQIAMSREKELGFFVEGKNWSRGVDWYASQFDADAAVRGESTPAYSAYPLYEGVPGRIAQVVPDAKLVYLVRDPIDRIVSHYTHRTINFPDMGTLEAALRDDTLRRWFVEPSRYWLQLVQYRAHFPDEQIIVVDSDELRLRRRETLESVFRFVGVDPVWSGVFAPEHNSAVGQTRLSRPGRAAVRALERTVGVRRSQAVRERLPTVLKARFR